MRQIHFAAFDGGHGSPQQRHNFRLRAKPARVERRRNRALAARFVSAYRKGLADYSAALLRLDASGKRVADETATKAAEQIGKYVYPSDPPAEAAKKVVAAAPYVDPQGRIDVADIERQIAWYKSEKLVDAGVEPRNVLDTSFAP